MLAAIDTLEELRTSLAALEGCALRNTAANMVFADGNAGARLMVIGDVPGRDEDRVGLPLVGPEGQLFDRMLASIGLSRADCYIVPLIPWRPPGNRTPTAEEMDLSAAMAPASRPACGPGDADAAWRRAGKGCCCRKAAAS